jgi:hypothetical protein
LNPVFRAQVTVLNAPEEDEHEGSEHDRSPRPYDKGKHDDRREDAHGGKDANPVAGDGSGSSRPRAARLCTGILLVMAALGSLLLIAGETVKAANLLLNLPVSGLLLLLALLAPALKPSSDHRSPPFDTLGRPGMGLDGELPPPALPLCRSDAPPRAARAATRRVGFQVRPYTAGISRS